MNPKTAYDAWDQFVWTFREFLHEYSPEMLVFFGFVLGFSVAGIMSVVMG